MTKTLNWNGSAAQLSENDVTTILGAAAGWFDPDSGQVVNHVNVHFDGLDGSGNPEFTLSIALQRVGIDPSNVQTTMDNLATAINNLEPDFGTVDEIKDGMRME